MSEAKPGRGSFTVKEEAPEQKYYGSVPHMVWYLGLHPLHITIYAYLIRVAGKEGICWQSTKTIAKATSVSAGKISEARKVLAAAGLIKITKPGSVGRGHSYEITIPNLWAINIGYIDGDPKYVAQVEEMARKVHAMTFSKKSSPGEPKTSPHEPKKNPEEEHYNTSESKNANSRRIPTETSASSSEVRGAPEEPKRILTGTGDSQRDHVDSADAGVSALQAKDLLAKELHRLLFPDVDYPTGKTKVARDTRKPYQLAADKLLEQVGRENYQEALDACYLLLTEPTKKEAAWIDEVGSPHGIMGTVLKRVNQLRREAKKRAAALEMNRQMLEQREYGIGTDPGLGSSESVAVVTPGLPEWAQEYAEIWRQAKADLELTMARATYDTWLADAVLQRVIGDGEFIRLFVGVGSQGAVDWLESKLKPVVKRSLAFAADRPIEISFVLKDGVEGEDRS